MSVVISNDAFYLVDQVLMLPDRRADFGFDFKVDLIVRIREDTQVGPASQIYEKDEHPFENDLYLAPI